MQTSARLANKPREADSPSAASHRLGPPKKMLLTWEEIVELYRLTLDQPLVNTQAH
jgi:hypothetical protein